MNRRSTRNRRHHATAAGGAPAFSPVTSVTSATCELWLDASLGITTVSGRVTAWADQSTIGDANRDFAACEPAFAAGGVANRPLYTATDAAYNNKPTIHFDGTDTRLGNTGGAWSGAIAQDYTIFFVGDFDGAVYNDHIINGADDGLLIYIEALGLLQYAGAVSNYVTQPTSPSVIAMRFNGATSTTYVNSTTAAVTGDAGAFGFQRLAIGNYHGLNGYQADGKIAEVLIYSTGLNATDRNAVIAYLGDKYGITIA